MSVRNLDALFKPHSVALIGATNREGAVGRVVADNLFASGFSGPIMPVNPKHRAVRGVLSYESVTALPIAPDLAIITTPPATVPELIRTLGEKGTRAAVVISAGVTDSVTTEDGVGLRQAMLDAARPHLLRVLGPNCIGMIVPGLGLNASFAHVTPQAGDLAFLSQSGAMVTALLDQAAARGIGFSHVVSLGDKADVDFGDLLDYMAADPNTKAVILYVEAVRNARKFMSAARACSRLKPVIVIKSGRHAEGAKAAASHTGAMAGSDAVYHAAFRRAGMLRVYSIEELFDAAQTLATIPKTPGNRLAIVTNGGGLGVLATDTLVDDGGVLATLSDETVAALDACLPPTWSRANPVDIIGDAPGARYSASVEAVLDDDGVDALLVMNCPTAIASSEEAARGVVTLLSARRHRSGTGFGSDPVHGKAVFTTWMGEAAADEARKAFSDAQIPTYPTPEQAVRAFMHLVRHATNQDELLQTPPEFPEDLVADPVRAGEVLDRALAEKRTWLAEHEAKTVLAAYGVPVVQTLLATTQEEVISCAQQLLTDAEDLVALKIVSPHITHKSDVGGVVLNLASVDEVSKAAEAMRERITELRPDAEITGFTIQQMARRRDDFELILGLTTDAQFGPVILFGHGGTAVEQLDDKALALPPLNMLLARRLIERTRVYRLLRGYRDRPSVNMDAICMTLIRLSQLATDLPQIAELDINPLLCDVDGVVALDARIRVAQPPSKGTRRLAIRPYPKRLETVLSGSDGTQIPIRPIRPEDEPALRDMVALMTPEDRRFRFFAPIQELSHRFAARLTQIDYDREMAFVATTEPSPGAFFEIVGVVRISCDPDNDTGEYAIAVRSDQKGRGLGTGLMQQIITYARDRGVRQIVGEVLAENTVMLQICRSLGFTVSMTDESDMRHVALKLAQDA